MYRAIPNCRSCNGNKILITNLVVFIWLQNTHCRCVCVICSHFSLYLFPAKSKITSTLSPVFLSVHVSLNPLISFGKWKNGTKMLVFRGDIIFLGASSTSTYSNFSWKKSFAFWVTPYMQDFESNQCLVHKFSLWTNSKNRKTKYSKKKNILRV